MLSPYSGMQKFWHPWSKSLLMRGVKQVEDEMILNMKHSFHYIKQYQGVIFVLSNFKEKKREAASYKACELLRPG